MNHCTLWLEGWWSPCCASHDRDYANQVGRAIADSDLFACVASSLPAVIADNPVMSSVVGIASIAIGGIMYVGVRVFGGRFYRR